MRGPKNLNLPIFLVISMLSAYKVIISASLHTVNCILKLFYHGRKHNGPKGSSLIWTYY